MTSGVFGAARPLPASNLRTVLPGDSLPWSGADVGRVGLTGRLSQTNGVFTIKGSGAGAYIFGDALHFEYLPVKDNCQITVRILSNGPTNSVVGLMARETLEYDSRDVFLSVKTNDISTVQCQSRRTLENRYEAAFATVSSPATATFPLWLRLTRTKYSASAWTFTAYQSSDGTEWTTLGSVIIGMTNCCYLGVAVCSQRINTLAEAVFDSVSFSGAIPTLDDFNGQIAGAKASIYTPPARDPQLDVIDALAAQWRLERSTNDAFFTAGKKLISCSFPYTPSEFVTNIGDWELRPFDGLVFRLAGGYVPYQTRPWSENSLVADYRALTNLNVTKFTDNFILVRPSTVDWFNDYQWQCVLTNTRLLTKAALLGKCAGLWLDAEAGSPVFAYYNAAGRYDRTFDEFVAQVKKRGTEWIQAVEAEMPKPKLLWAFLCPASELNTYPTYDITRVREALPTMTYGLLPAFVNGILEGASEGTELIEGDESAFYYRSKWEYTNFAGLYMKQLYPHTFIKTNLLVKWTNQVKFGPALYPNWYFGRRSITLSQPMTPEERGKWYEHNAYWALATSDRYAWDWFEHGEGLWSGNWTTTNEIPYGIPSYHVSSLTNARYKVANSLPLGYDSDSLFAGLRIRADAMRPTATITHVTYGHEPVIDGVLDDTVWSTNVALSSFIQMLSYTQTVCQVTRGKLCYDTNALYVAFECMEEAPGGMKTNETRDTFALMADDNVLVLLQSPTNAAVMYRFVLNGVGVKADALCYTNTGSGAFWYPWVANFGTYNSGWIAAAKVNTYSWTAEAKIPWNRLGGLSPVPGTKLLMNLGRYRSQSVRAERTYWSPVLEMQGDTMERMEPSLFGTATLE